MDCVKSCFQAASESINSWVKSTRKHRTKQNFYSALLLNVRQ